MAELQTLPVAAVGGLDTVSPPQILAQNPGLATELINYEPLAEGGYRKMKGYTRYGDIPDAYGSLEIRGIGSYKGIVAVIGDNVLHSYNGATWYVVNKKGIDATPKKDVDTVALDKIPRLGERHVQFQTFLEGSKEVVVITDDKSKPAILYYDAAQRTYQYNEVDLADTAGYRFVTKYQDHVVIGGSIGKPGSIAVSDRFKPDTYTGGGSWAAQVTDEIVGLKVFRDFLYIFCRHSIYRVQNLESSANTQIRPVTTKVGCVDGRTIQEIGGDILFLSDDGLRYLGATERIDDVSINLVSAPVRSLIDSISLHTGPVSSVVIPDKAQYRIFFTTLGGRRMGLIGTLGADGKFVWSTTSDMNVDDITDSVLDESLGVYKVFHIGKHLGIYRVYQHDYGVDFDGSPYESRWSTPYFHMGDAGIRKSLHDVNIYLEAEDKAELELIIKFDHESSLVIQPEPFYLAPVIKAARYGEAIYSGATYGALRYPLESIFLEGSGKWVQLTFKDSAKDNKPYIIRGFDMQFNAGGRL